MEIYVQRLGKAEDNKWLEVGGKPFKSVSKDVVLRCEANLLNKD